MLVGFACFCLDLSFDLNVGWLGFAIVRLVW